MTESVPHEEAQLDWTLIAQAEGVLSARERVSITEAAEMLRDRAQALGMPVEHVARELVDSTRSPDERR